MRRVLARGLVLPPSRPGRWHNSTGRKDYSPWQNGFSVWHSSCLRGLHRLRLGSGARILGTCSMGYTARSARFPSSTRTRRIRRSPKRTTTYGAPSSVVTSSDMTVHWASTIIGKDGWKNLAWFSRRRSTTNAAEGPVEDSLRRSRPSVRCASPDFTPSRHRPVIWGGAHRIVASEVP